MAEKPSYTEEVDKKFKEEFETILDKDINDLTEYDKQFLVARRHLLNGDQLEKFASVIDDTLTRNTGESLSPKKSSKSKEE